MDAAQAAFTAARSSIDWHAVAVLGNEGIEGSIDALFAFGKWHPRRKCGVKVGDDGGRGLKSLGRVSSLTKKLG